MKNTPTQQTTTILKQQPTATDIIKEPIEKTFSWNPLPQICNNATWKEEYIVVLYYLEESLLKINSAYQNTTIVTHPGNIKVTFMQLIQARKAKQ